MAKGIPIGLVLGAILAFALFKAVESRRAGQAPAPAGDKKAGGPEAKSSDEESKLKADLAAAEEEGKALEAKLRALEGNPAGSPGGSAAKKKRDNPWGDIAAKVYKLRKQLKDMEERGDPEMQELMLGFIDVARKLQEEYGVTMDELNLCPFGMPMLMLAVLEASETPPDAGQAEKLGRMFDAAEKEWQDYMKEREELTAMEQKRALLGMSGVSTDSMKSLLTPDQAQIWKDLDMITEERVHVNRWSTMSPTRDGVATAIGDEWKRRLSLDDGQAAAIRPLVDTYMAEYDRMQADFAARTASGEKVSDKDRAVAELDLMIRTQERISETVRLTADQEKALGNWDGITGYTIGQAGTTVIEED